MENGEPCFCTVHGENRTGHLATARTALALPTTCEVLDDAGATVRLTPDGGTESGTGMLSLSTGISIFSMSSKQKRVATSWIAA